MTNRITTDRLGKTGLFVSAPGRNVLTCADEDLSFSSEWATLQVIESTDVYYGEAGATSDPLKTVTHANYGFRPFVILEYPGFTQAQYQSFNGGYFDYEMWGRTQTTFTFHRPNILGSGTNYAAFTLRYRLLSIGPGGL